MNTTPSNVCQNCNAKNELPFKYCKHCGQKNTDGKITFAELWTEFQDAVFNIESRTWRTLKHLFIPGKLTLEYFAGKHRKYVHPLRLLIVTSFLLIIAMSFQDFQSTTNHTYDIKERIVKNYERQRIYRMVKSISDSTQVIFPDTQTTLITDTIISSLRDSLISMLTKHGDRYGDSINLSYYVSMGSEADEKISKRDFLTKDEAELVALYKQDAKLMDRLIFKQKIKLINDESQIFSALIGHITWAVLLMMPCLALVLYLLNIRHGYYYIEHLIFAFHIHAFLFIVLAILIGGLNLFPYWIFYLCIPIILLYTLVSMWKVYQQSFGKIVFKFLILGLSYTGIFVLFLVGNIFLSFLLL